MKQTAPKPAPATPTVTFDAEVRAQLGPRPLRSDPDFARLNREWDRAYAALFPNALLPSYLPKWNKRGSRNHAA